jgi:hypothetical protein
VIALSVDLGQRKARHHAGSVKRQRLPTCLCCSKCACETSEIAIKRANLDFAIKFARKEGFVKKVFQHSSALVLAFA